jgi:hypothetical protein
MKFALKHALTAIILILSLAAPVAAGPHEDARNTQTTPVTIDGKVYHVPKEGSGGGGARPPVTGYNAAGFNPYTGQPSPPMPTGLDLHSIDKNGNPIPFKFDPATGKPVGSPQDPAALSAKAQAILDAQTKAAPDAQPAPRSARAAAPAPAPALGPAAGFTPPANRPPGQFINPSTGQPWPDAPRYGKYAPQQPAAPAALRIAPAPSVGTTACQRYPNLC